MANEARWSGGTFSLPDGSVTDESISQNTNVDADKLQHLFGHPCATCFDLGIGDTPAGKEEIVFVAGTAGVIRGFHCLLNDTGTSTNVDFDLKVNGASVLSSAVNITHSAADRDVSDGTISSAAIAAGDVVSISLAVTSATGAQGPYAWVLIEENATT